jgi:RTX calcium-binding nonapeptide repeat (4 copies)/FG-GAP-like repeat
MNTNLNPALSLVDRYLAQFATSPNFWSDFELAFGKNFDRLTAEQIRQKLSVGGFTRSIQIVQDQVLGLASGAFAAATNTVYLRESLVASGDLEHISEVIIEEYGHSIDSLVNKEETPGDEGAIFRLLVKGFKLTQAMLAELRAEDDWAVISIDGQQLAVEMAVFNGTTGNDTLGGVVAGDNIGDDIFTPLTGRDVVNGGEGVDTLIVDYSTITGNIAAPGISVEYSTSSRIDGIVGTKTDLITPIANNQVTFFSIEKYNITGTQESDRIDTGAGNDTISGGAGNDTLAGDDGDNVISGGDGNDLVFVGGPFGDGGSNYIDLGAGDDSVLGATGNDTIYGGTGNDDIYGYSNSFPGNDRLDGGAGNDTIRGGSGSDTLLGGGGSDTLIDQSGNDSYILESGVSSSGTSITDAGGNDNLQFATPVTLNLATDFYRYGRSLFIDLNGDKRFDRPNDLIIYGFFDAAGNAGSGFIETIQNLSGTDILNSTRSKFSVRNDFNNDKKSDILWRNTDGHVGLWTMDGSNILDAKVVAPWFTDTNWQIAGTGDFNNDTKSDILWQNTDGHIGLWTMDGATILSTSVVAPWFSDKNWKIAGTGDFNGDTKIDILWRNADGHVGLWTMDGTNIMATDVIAPWFNDSAWTIAGTGDFDGDGRSDILWRNNDGTLSVWLMDGTAVTASYTVPLANDWKIRGIDNNFAGSDESRILLEKDSGEISVGSISNASLVFSPNYAGAYNGSPFNQLIGTGDFNLDGSTDILWRNLGRDVFILQSNGSYNLSASSVGSADVSWQIAAPII